MITFQEETYQDIKNEIISLLVEHWKEMEMRDEKKIPLKPIWEWYKIFSEKEILYILTCRNDQKLIGYCTFILAPHIHHADIRVAECDLIYISPPYRKGWTGYFLIKKAIIALKQKVNRITIGMRINHLFLPIVKRLGFRLTEYKVTLEV